MKFNYYILALFFLFSSCKEKITIYEIFLPLKINETSGLEFFNGNFITHNDSGGETILYEFTEKGEIINEHFIMSCGENNDWEDITSDNKYTFIANTGNNYGTRDNLNILILDKENNFTCKGEIKFVYKEQKNFKKRNKHRFDSEGIISAGDSLVLFSKDRKNLITELYSLPKIPGEYKIEPIYSYKVNALITGADYNEKLKLVALVGYDFNFNQYFYTINNFDLTNLDNSVIEKFSIPIEKAQIEAVKIIDENSFWATSEDEGNGYPRLFKLKI